MSSDTLPTNPSNVTEGMNMSKIAPVGRRWPKIFTVGDPRLFELFTCSVSITEKLDGSQINFGVGLYPPHDLWVYSKNAVVDINDPPTLFAPAVAHILKIKDALIPGFSYHGEAFQSRKHNTLEYGRTPKNHIALYGIISAADEAVPDKELEYFSKHLDLETVPIIEADIKITESSEVLRYLDRVSELGNTKIEGIVIKNYKRDLFFNGRTYPLLQGKIVTETFKEKHKENPEYMDPIERIISQYNREPRWQKALLRFQEENNRFPVVQDIGPLVGMISKDFVDEEKEYIKEKLWEIYKKRIVGSQSKGFPEWLKLQLVGNHVAASQENQNDA